MAGRNMPPYRLTWGIYKDKTLEECPVEYLNFLYQQKRKFGDAKRYPGFQDALHQYHSSWCQRIGRPPSPPDTSPVGRRGQKSATAFQISRHFPSPSPGLADRLRSNENVRLLPGLSNSPRRKQPTMAIPSTEPTYSSLSSSKSSHTTHSASSRLCRSSPSRSSCYSDFLPFAPQSMPSSPPMTPSLKTRIGTDLNSMHSWYGNHRRPSVDATIPRVPETRLHPCTPDYRATRSPPQNKAGTNPTSPEIRRNWTNPFTWRRQPAQSQSSQSQQREHEPRLSPHTLPHSCYCSDPQPKRRRSTSPNYVLTSKRPCRSKTPSRDIYENMDKDTVSSICMNMTRTHEAQLQEAMNDARVYSRDFGEYIVSETQRSLRNAVEESQIEVMQYMTDIAREVFTAGTQCQDKKLMALEAHTGQTVDKMTRLSTQVEDLHAQVKSGDERHDGHAMQLSTHLNEGHTQLQRQLNCIQKGNERIENQLNRIHEENANLTRQICTATTALSTQLASLHSLIADTTSNSQGQSQQDLKGHVLEDYLTLTTAELREKDDEIARLLDSIQGLDQEKVNAELVGENRGRIDGFVRGRRYTREMRLSQTQAEQRGDGGSSGDSGKGGERRIDDQTLALVRSIEHASDIELRDQQQASNAEQLQLERHLLQARNENRILRGQYERLQRRQQQHAQYPAQLLSSTQLQEKYQQQKQDNPSRTRILESIIRDLHKHSDNSLHLDPNTTALLDSAIKQSQDRTLITTLRTRELKERTAREISGDMVQRLGREVARARTGLDMLDNDGNGKGEEHNTPGGWGRKFGWLFSSSASSKDSLTLTSDVDDADENEERDNAEVIIPGSF